MRIRRMTRAPVLASGALAVSLALAAPAIGDAIGAGGGGGQPPPGANAVEVDDSTRPAYVKQPPAGAKAVKFEGRAPASAKQPANSNPQKAGKPTQVSGPEEKKSPKVRDRGGNRADKGGAGGADRKGGRKD